MNEDGSVAWQHSKWLKNLILDSGLDKVAAMPWASAFQFCVAGTGTTPTKVTTASNASQTGTTVSITAGSYSFSPSIVGKLLWWPGTQQSAKVTSYTNTTTVTVATSQTVSAALFEVYNVDQTALVTPYSMNMRYQTGEDMCGTIIEGDVVTMFRTFDFYIESSPVQITELGFKDTPKSTTLFSRVLLPDVVFLAAGQWLQVSYQLSIKLSPSTPNGKSPTVTGWPILPATTTTGSEQIQLYGLCVVDVNGIARPYDRSQLCNEPFAPGTNYLGPQFGYVNRWENGNGSPVKLYAQLARNPFTNPRNTAAKFASTGTGSYVPPLVELNTMQWTGTTLSYVTSNTSTNYLFTSVDIGSVIKIASGIGGFTYVKVVSINTTTSVTVSIANPGVGSLSAVCILYYNCGSTGPWGGEIENAADMMQPIVEAPSPVQVTRVAGQTPGWNGVDPQSSFPNAVPYSGEVPWGNWQVDFAPTSATPTTITLTATPQNFVSPTYQWQKLVDVTWTDIPGATNSTLPLLPSDIIDLDDVSIFSSVVQFRVVLDGADPSTDFGSVSYSTITAIRQNQADPAYYIVLTNPHPAIRRTSGNAAVSGDNGSSGRVKSSIRVFRDLVELTIAAFSSSTFPGPGRFSFSDNNNTLIDTLSNVVYYSSATVSASSFTFPLLVKMETSASATVNWLVDAISGATVSTPVVDVSSSSPVFLVGGGLEDVTGAAAFIGEDSDGPATIGTCVDRSVARHVELPLTLAAYTPGTFTRLKQATFLTNMANGTNWRTLGIGAFDPDTQVVNRKKGSQYNGYVFIFDEAQTKIKQNYLTVNFRYTWNRDLTT